MTDLSMFYQKNGLTVRNIARDLLCLNEGDIMTSIAEYTDNFGLSRWTIQTAIQFLLENKCMKVEKHGPNGTNVYDLDYPKLWEIANFSPFVGMAAPPDTNIHQSLYTGLAQAIKPTPLPYILGYMVPAGVRIEALLSGRCHFIVVSKLSAKILKQRHENLIVPLEITGAVYAPSFKIYSKMGSKPDIHDGTVVGYPQDSVDIKFVTEQLCEGKKVVYKYGSYHACANMLEKGEIDVLIQRRDINEYYNRNYPSASLDKLGLDEEIMTPVLLCDGNDYGVDKVIRRFINPLEVAQIQQEVLDGKRLYDFF